MIYLVSATKPSLNPEIVADKVDAKDLCGAVRKALPNLYRRLDYPDAILILASKMIAAPSIPHVDAKGV